MGAICLYGRNARHEKRHLMQGYLHHHACGFNGEMDQLDHFHALRCILEDLVHAVGWSGCECSASRIPLSLVCFVDCRLSTAQPVARCLVGHSLSEKAAAWPEGRLPAGWGGSCGDRSQRLVCSVAGVDPVDLRSHAHSWACWKAREQEVEVECGARGRGRRFESRDDQICHHRWLTKTKLWKRFHTSDNFSQSHDYEEYVSLCPHNLLNSLCWTTDGQCPLDIYLFL